MANLSIIGAGAWGSALSIALSDNFEQIYLHTHHEITQKKHKIKHPTLNTNYPDNVQLVFDLTKIEICQSVLIAVPSFAFAQTLNNIKPHLKDHHISWATKGFDTHNQCFLHQSFERILADYHACAISGPSFALEITKHKPSAIVVASKHKISTEYWAKTLRTKTLRAYTNIDIIGVEVGGAVKNVLAIAAGIAAGLGFGANTQAALITRGLAEMIRFGCALGAVKSTFNGLSGLGDLVLSCSDDLSRNRRFGKQLAYGDDAETAKNKVGATIEGLNVLALVLSIAAEKHIEMPICEQVSNVTKGKISPAQALTQLMSRQQIDE